MTQVTEETGSSLKAKDQLPRMPEPGPSKDLAPTARRILDAAKRLLIERGYPGLRLEAISAEAESNKAMIRYYFGSKAGLEAALVEDLTYEEIVRLDELTREAMGAEERVAAQLSALRVLVETTNLWCQYDILPHAMRNRDLGNLMAKVWEWYREVFVHYFFGQEADQGNSEQRGLSSVLMAVVDGLAIQQALPDSGFDSDAAWGALEKMVKLYLASLEKPKKPAEDVAPPVVASGCET